MTAVENKSVARFADRSRIETIVKLEYPIEYDGKIWDAITVSSPTVAQVAAFSERVAEARKLGESTDGIRLPMFDAPDAVLDALHLDDDDLVSEAANRFLPRRFRASPESTLGSNDGNISPIS